jgi:hypothetical protein
MLAAVSCKRLLASLRLRGEHFLQDGENLLEGARRELAQAADEACAIDRAELIEYHVA